MSITASAGAGSDTVQLLMLRKALSAEQLQSAQLLAGLPEPAPAAPAPADASTRTFYL